MTTFRLVKILIVALPEIIRLINNLDKRLDDAALDAKITEDLKGINDAFEKKDGAALTAIFNS